MANLAGGVLPITISSMTLDNNRESTDSTLAYASSNTFGGRIGNVIILGGAFDVLIMEAKDSVTGITYTWPVDTPDFDGVYYPGPNLPIQIAIREVRDSYGQDPS